MDQNKLLVAPSHLYLPCAPTLLKSLRGKTHDLCR
jgi:hypothetical protein